MDQVEALVRVVNARDEVVTKRVGGKDVAAVNKKLDKLRDKGTLVGVDAWSA